MRQYLLILILTLLLVMNAGAEKLLSDPTRPPSSGALVNNKSAGKKINYKVSQIHTGSGKSFATINDQHVTIGERIGDAEVLAIQSTSVSLLINGDVHQITIVPSIKNYKK